MPGMRGQAISFGTAPTLAIGDTVSISATATSGLAVSFSSSTPSICTVSGSTVAGINAGICTIVANQPGGSSFFAATAITQNITVAAKDLTGLAITGVVSVNEGNSTSYTLTASYYANHPPASVTGMLTLTNTTYATLSGGTLTAGTVTADQTITLNATYTENGVSKTATLPVTIVNTANVLTGLAISGAASVNEGSTSAYTLTASYANNPSVTVTGTLALLNTTYASMTGGTLTAATVTANQAVTLNASYTEGGITKTTTLPVTIVNTVNVLTSLAITGVNSVDEGGAASYTLTASYDNNTSATVFGTLTLVSTNFASLNGGTLSAAGTVLADQLVTLNASYTEGGMTKAASLPVTIKNSVNLLTGIAIKGASSLAEGGANDVYTVTATYDNASTATVTPAKFSASGIGAILVGNQLLTSTVNANQTITLSASYTEGGITQTATLPVTIINTPVLTGVTIVGAASVNEKATATYSLNASYDDGSSKAVTPVWSLTGSAATFASGVLTANSVTKNEAVTLVASYVEGGNSKTATLAISIVNSIIDTPTSVDLVLGWNLLGNGIDVPQAVVATFGDVDKVVTVWKWLPVSSKWAFYTPSLVGQALTDYAVGKGYEVLTSIDGGEGYWVNAKQPFVLPLPTGNVVTALSLQPKLQTGWSLASIGETQTPRQINDAVAPAQFNTALGGTPPNPGAVNAYITTLWAWDAGQTAWYFYAPTLDARGSTALADYCTSKGYIDFTLTGKSLGAGVGFWVNKP